MTLVISFRFDFHFFIKGMLKIHTGLVGQTHHNKDNIGEFLPQVFCLVTLFFTLLYIPSDNDTGNLTHLLGQLGHVGQLIKITNTVFLDPVVYNLLYFLQFHLLANLKLSRW